MQTKIIDLQELAQRARELRGAGKKLVVTNGCFDLLHLGHVRYLQAARKLGDALAVGLNGDRSVSKLKGNGRPINNESDRAEILAALSCVDFVSVFPEMRATRLIRAAQPAIYAKGGDYTSESLDVEERAAVQRVGAKTVILPLVRGKSTSQLIQRVTGSK